MMDPGWLAALLERMAEEVRQLRKLATLPAAQLLDDPVALPAAKYRLVVAIEAAVDGAEHMIASERLRASTSYADAFAVLGEAGWLDPELAGVMQEAARFRNLLVHGYVDVDDQRVVGILGTRLGDLEVFRTEVARRALSGG